MPNKRSTKVPPTNIHNMGIHNGFIITALAFKLSSYILAPAHHIQADTPLENIFAMYDREVV